MGKATNIKSHNRPSDEKNECNRKWAGAGASVGGTGERDAIRRTENKMVEWEAKRTKKWMNKWINGKNLE